MGAYWTEHPQANIGLVMDNAVEALDVDMKKGKDGWRSYLEIGGPASPPWPRQHTPSGGLHFLARRIPSLKLRGFNGRGSHGGLDMCTGCAYIVAAPSVLEGGKPYQWADGNLDAPYPPQMLKALQGFSRAVLDRGQDLPMPSVAPMTLEQTQGALETLDQRHRDFLDRGIGYHGNNSQDAYYACRYLFENDWNLEQLAAFGPNTILATFGANPPHNAPDPWKWCWKYTVTRAWQDSQTERDARLTVEEMFGRPDIPVTASGLFGDEFTRAAAQLPEGELQELRNRVKATGLCEVKQWDRAVDRARKNGIGAAGAGQETLGATDRSKTPESLSDLLTRFAYVTDGDRVADLALPAHCALMTLREFKNTYIAQESTVRTWLEHPRRETLRAIGYHPQDARVYNNEDVRYFNEFTFPEHPRVEHPDPAPFLEHIGFLIPQEDRARLFLDWLAHIVQRPWERPQHWWLILAGQQGTGRGLVNAYMQRVLGAWNCSHSGISDLVESPFQDVLYRSLWMSLPESRDRGKPGDRFTLDDRTRDKLTEANLSLNTKYGPKHKNTAIYTRPFGQSNHVHDAMRLQPEDRRTIVHEVVAAPRSQDYYNAQYQGIVDVAPALYWWLKARDLSGYSPGDRAIETPEKTRLIEEAFTDAERVVRELQEALPPGLDVLTYRQITTAVGNMHIAEDLEEFRGLGQKGLMPALRDQATRFMPHQGGKVFWNGNAHRVWILRNPDLWQGAAPEKIRHQLDSAEIFVKTLPPLPSACHGSVASGNVLTH